MKNSHKAIIASVVLLVLGGLIVGNVMKANSEKQEAKPIPFDINVFDANYKRLSEQYDDVYEFNDVYVYADISRNYGEGTVTPLSAFYNDDKKIDMIVFEDDKPSANQLDIIYKSLEMDITDEYLELLEEVKTWNEPNDMYIKAIKNNGISMNVSYYNKFRIMVSADD